MEPSNRGVDLWRKLVMSIGLQWRDRCEKDPIGEPFECVDGAPLKSLQHWHRGSSSIRRAHLLISCWAHERTTRALDTR